MKCIGPRGFVGCPYGADVKPEEQTIVGDVLSIRRYWHCWRCFEVYRSQGSGPADSWTTRS